MDERLRRVGPLAISDPCRWVPSTGGVGENYREDGAPDRA
jgi:hypothetical protein